MSERLIELISQIQYMGGLESRLAEHLLANGVIVPPCKVGDMVYSCLKDAYKVKRIVMESNSKHIKFVAESGLNGQFIFDETNFGKTVFLTKEEAEEKLKELKR